MPDKKLTYDKLPDGEIKKVLECCLYGDCQDCFYGDTDQRCCRDDLMQNCLEYFNRLQAQNGLYETCNARKDEAINSLESRLKVSEAENERLKSECEKQYKIAEATIRAEIADGGTSCHWCEDTIRGVAKAEAYKECIEKVKALFPSDNEPYQYWEIHEGADNLLKELVGEDNGKEKE